MIDGSMCLAKATTARSSPSSVLPPPSPIDSIKTRLVFSVIFIMHPSSVINCIRPSRTSAALEASTW